MEDIRQKIDEIDAQMAVLYEQRLDCALKIAEYKFNNNEKIYVPEREKEVINKNVTRIRNKAYKARYKAFLQYIMDQSKQLQEEHTEWLRKENH